MLSKAHRINKRNDFDGIFRRGGVSQNSFLAIRFLPNQNKFSRFGLVISVKAAKKAVSRNRLRRRLNEILRLNLQKIRPGWDIVLIAKAKLAEADYSAIQMTLFDLLKKKDLYAG